MTYEDIALMAEECGFPCVYDHFAQGESPDPPFLIFLFPRSNNFSADDRVYVPISELHFELYTDKKDPEAERNIEAVLDKHNLFYDKTEAWIPEERLFEVLYSMEVIYK